MKDSQTLHLVQNQKDYLLQIDVHPIQKKVQDVKEKLTVQIRTVELGVPTLILIQDYAQVIKINPKDSDAFFNRANVKKEIGDMEGACKDWRKATDLGDDDAKKFLKEHCE